ncbi:hypothetical protein CSKR_202299 [Clonorchis sinensis]|uniref:Uncharacterized protein n=1 Tax=Clonorchis sinensis TaxID=79923 RepID=A0A8T1MTQ6_CLOSI|nr:hypothetical protein CSKR_202299 [Clonorchis sinensis]
MLPRFKFGRLHLPKTYDHVQDTVVPTRYCVFLVQEDSIVLCIRLPIRLNSRNIKSKLDRLRALHQVYIPLKCLVQEIAPSTPLTKELSPLSFHTVRQMLLSSNQTVLAQ